MLDAGVKRLSKLQERLYAEGRWAILAVLQGLDTAGKDGVIKHVLSGINPQGCEVHSFKRRAALELAHDFCGAARSRCRHAAASRSSTGPTTRRPWSCACTPSCSTSRTCRRSSSPTTSGTERYEDINNFELHLARSGTVPIKFFLNISKDEQLKRLLARVDDPDKRWKFNLYDVEERRLWEKFLEVYEDTIRNTSTVHAPWYVIPADRKWFARLVVAAVLVERMEALDLQYPKFDEASAASAGESASRAA